MTDLSNLEQLRARVMEAKGAMALQEALDCASLSPWAGGTAVEFARALQGSVDAAIAFIERVLPGWFWRASGPSRSQVGMCIGRLFWPETPAGQHGVGHYGEAATPALALVAAALSALIVKEKAGE